MKPLAIAIAVVVAALSLPVTVLAQPQCDQGQQLRTETFTGEVIAGQSYVRELRPNVTFRLSPRSHGWGIEILDEAGVDRSAITPPLRMQDVNPRNIAGWHFRNAANTGANTGDVNAPQNRRAFRFGPPPRPQDPDELPNGLTVEPQAGEFGAGVLTIEDFGLAGLNPDERARMTYLRFSVCVSWVRGYEEDGLAEFLGLYRQGFEQSTFLTDDGRRLYLQGGGKGWEQVENFRVERPGRGSFIAARLRVRARMEPFDLEPGIVGAHAAKLVVEEILSAEAISDTEFQTRARQLPR